MSRAFRGGAAWWQAGGALGCCLGLFSWIGAAESETSPVVPDVPAPAIPGPAVVPLADPPAAPPALPAQPVPQVALPPQAFAPGGFFPAFDTDESPTPPPRLNPGADPAEAEEDRVASQEGAVQTLEEAQSHAIFMMRNNDNEDSLHGALALLELSLNQPQSNVNQLQCLERLAAAEWPRKPRETIPQMLRRRMIQALPAEEEEFGRRRFRHWSSLAQLEQLRAQYEEAAGTPWPMNWRAREEHWLGVLTEFAIARDAEDPLAFWKARIAADAMRADWRRLCYLATMRVREEVPIDLGPLGPWLDPGQPATFANLLRSAEIYRMTISRELGIESTERIAARKLFLALLRRTTLPNDLFETPLGDVMIEICQSDEEESRQVMAVVLETKSPRLYHEWATQIGIGRGQVHQSFLARHVAVDCREQPLEAVLRDLAGRVVLPLWIDDEAAAAKTKITVKAEGAWIDVVDRILESTPYRLQKLRLDVLWIGRLERRRAADSLLAEALANSVAANGDSSTALADPIDLELKAEPLRSALLMASEAISAPIYWLGDGDGPTVSRRFQELPLCLSLAFLARDAKVELGNVGGFIAIGPADRIARLQARHESHLRRLAVLSQRRDEVGRALCESSGVSLSEMSLDEALMGFQLGEMGRVALVVDGSSKLNPFRKVDFPYFSDATPAWGLDLLAYEFSLEWESDNEGAYLVEPSVLAAIRERQATRAARRKALPAALTSTLATPLTDSFKDRPLSEVCKWLSESLQMPVRCQGTPADLAKRSVTATLNETPADVSLDLIAAALGLDWQLVDAKVIQFRPRAAQP